MLHFSTFWSVKNNDHFFYKVAYVLKLWLHIEWQWHTHLNSCEKVPLQKQTIIVNILLKVARELQISIQNYSMNKIFQNLFNIYSSTNCEHVPFMYAVFLTAAVVASDFNASCLLSWRSTSLPTQVLVPKISICILWWVF